MGNRRVHMDPRYHRPEAPVLVNDRGHWVCEAPECPSRQETGHAWRWSAKVGEVLTGGNGCPACGGTKVSVPHLRRPGMDKTRAYAAYLADEGYPFTVAEGAEWISVSTPIPHVCPAGHEWSAQPNNVMHPRSEAQGTGCPDCAERGWRRHAPSYIYLVYLPDYEYMKVGKANHERAYDRLDDHKRVGWKLANRWDVPTGDVATAVEAEILAWWRAEGVWFVPREHQPFPPRWRGTSEVVEIGVVDVPRTLAFITSAARKAQRVYRARGVHRE